MCIIYWTWIVSATCGIYDKKLGRMIATKRVQRFITLRLRDFCWEFSLLVRMLNLNKYLTCGGFLGRDGFFRATRWKGVTKFFCKENLWLRHRLVTVPGKLFFWFVNTVWRGQKVVKNKFKNNSNTIVIHCFRSSNNVMHLINIF